MSINDPPPLDDGHGRHGQRAQTHLRSNRTSLPPLFISHDITKGTKRAAPILMGPPTQVPVPTLLGAWQRPLTGTSIAQAKEKVLQPIIAPLEVSAPSTSAALNMHDGPKSADQPCPFNLNTKAHIKHSVSFIQS